MVLVQKRNRTSPCLKLYGQCLKVFGTKRTHSRVCVLKVEALFAAEGRHCFARSAHARDNGTIRVNALTGPWLQSCGLITGS
jgi:hypothetical protein